MLSATIEGVDDVIAAFRQREADWDQGARDTMDGHGIGVMNQTAETSPFDTGFMASHVTYLPDEDGYGWDVGWLEEDFVSEGFFPYYIVQELGSVKQDPQPSLGPSFDQSAPILERDIGDMLIRTFTRGA